MSEESTGSGAWTLPGAFEVAPGVHRVPLPLPEDALRAVNVYVLSTPDGLVLVDGGWAIPAAREALGAALAELGAGVQDVRQLLVTHVHRDHYTLAVALRAETGARVALGLGEKPTLDLLAEPARRPLAEQVAALAELGAHELLATVGERMGSTTVDVTQWAAPDTWLTPGPVTLPGGRSLEAVATPGHTAGHLVFHDLDAGLLFAGDHVLPTITPSIGFEPVRTDDPLGAFLGSLALVRERPDALLLPAHGPAGGSVHARVDELVAHHGRRLDDTCAAVAAGASTPAEVAARLGWTRRGRPYSSLDPFNATLAVFETAAHLRLLQAQGRVRLTWVDGVRHHTAG